MTISELAKTTGLPAKRIRYYESIGLIPPAQRAENGYRVYHRDDVQRLHFIHRSRELGFSLNDIQDLMALWQDKGRSSKSVKALALRHIEDIDQRIENLHSIRQTLKNLTDACQGDDRPNCPILEDFAKEH